MNKNLKVIPVKSVEYKEEKDIHPNLPQPLNHRSFILLNIGPTASGKSCTVAWLLLNENAYGGKKPVWDKHNVHIFSPTILSDDTDRFYVDYFNCYEKYEDATLKEIIAQQEALEKKDREKLLVVFNDMIGLIPKRSGAFVNAFCSRNRHWNCNIIHNVQALKGVSPMVRINASNVCLFAGINSKDLEMIEEQYGGVFKGTLSRLYYAKTKKKYSFIHIMPREVPARMTENFTKEIKWEKYIDYDCKANRLMKGIDSDSESESESD